MTLTDAVDKAINGWMIDKKISVPVIIATVTAAISVALFFYDVRNEGRSNTKEIATLKEELGEQRAYTKAIPQISERVGRLEATVAASVNRQERQFEEIMGAIRQNSPKNSAPARRP